MCESIKTFLFLASLVLFFTVFHSFKSTDLQVDNTNLIAVAVVQRHGDRAPSISYPLDENFNTNFWHMGFGQLTKKGIKRMYGLGQWYRQRYKNFLSETYSKDEIYIHSSNIDRCLMSITTLLAGLYPPKGYQLWNEQLEWQPIPVHTESIYVDQIITENRECKKFDQLSAEYQQTEILPLEKNYTELLELISRKTGWSTTTFAEVATLYNEVLSTYKSFNPSVLPDWLSELDMNAMEYISVLLYGGSIGGTQDIIRLRIGCLYHYLFQYFDSFSDLSLTRRPKFLLIGAHDLTVLPLLKSMDAFTKLVKFGEAIIWELRQQTDGSLFINVFYRKQDDLQQLDILECGFNCNYSEYRRTFEKFSLDPMDWEIECNS
ncbi:prostatic acid phosphatase-like isoform X1 [Diabrotica undecimpunctata]|uniref:prostatic acid phosphatase-like isoform X1 n=1 Tax=Diabrotica undecimpunctata TaxID=50387 RepID=UPI003B6343C5